MNSSRLSPVLLMALVFGCATPRASLRAEQPRNRITDSPAEKMSAMPVPDPTADPENKDQRFGIESARARKETARRQQDEQRRCVDVVSDADAAKGSKPPCQPPKK